MEISEDAKAVEHLVLFNPHVACGQSEHLIEEVVLWTDENDDDLKLLYDTLLYNITKEMDFNKILGYKVYE